MDSDFEVLLWTLLVPISLAVLLGSLGSCFLISKRHTVAGIIAGIIISPTIIFLLLLTAYLYVALQIQEMDRVMPNAPERDIYYQGWAMLLAAAEGFAVIDSAIALGITLSVSLVYLVYQAITSTDPHKSAPKGR
jgi:hypothetical protein